MTAPALDRHRGILPPRLHGTPVVHVVDTCFLFDEAASRIRGDAEPRVVGMGQTRWFAPTRVAEELANTLVTGAETRNVTPESLSDVLATEFVPLIRFVDLPEGEPISDPRVARVARLDIDDVDCARLAVLLAPCHVLSPDRDLRKPGLAPANRAALEAVLVASNSAGDRGVLFAGGTGISYAAVAGLAMGTRRLSDWLDVPSWFVALSGVALAAGSLRWLRSSPERRARLGSATRNGVDAIAQVLARSEEARRFLDETSIAPPDIRAAAHSIAWALARADGPLLAGEITERIATRGSDSPSVSEVRALLASHSAFVCVDRYRWQLGRARAFDSV